MTQGELSNVVYNKIKTATPYSEIILPDRHIVLPCIVIKHPLVIRGTPGTIVEIVNGNVVCDFRAFMQENNFTSLQNANIKAVISEVSLIFKLDLNKIYDRLKEI